MNLRYQNLPTDELMTLEAKIGSILADFPETKTEARKEYFDLLQKIYDLVPDFQINEILKLNDKVENIFHLTNELFCDVLVLSNKLNEQIKLNKSKNKLLLAKNLAITHQSFSVYPNGDGLDVNKDEEFISQLSSLVQHYTDVKYPAAFLGGETQNVINDLVGSDPLYLCVNSNKLPLFKAKIDNDFYYNSRLRKYQYDVFNLECLDQLPREQFNLIVSIGHVDMLPAFNIGTYFNKVKSLLRPGGIFIFSFFDTGIPYSAKLMELHMVTEMGKHAPLIDKDPTWWKRLESYPLCYELSDYTKIINNAGLKFLNYSQFINHSLIVCRRYGELTTAKRAQTLGEIILQQQ